MNMTTEPNFIILYVDNVESSTLFYQHLLGKKALEAASTFAMFALESGMKLGLWSKHTVEPAAQASGGGGELAFAVANSRLQEIYSEWTEQGLTIIQTPTEMDFGYTFVALDPDGHRLRVFE